MKFPWDKKPSILKNSRPSAFELKLDLHEASIAAREKLVKTITIKNKLLGSIEESIKRLAASNRLNYLTEEDLSQLINPYAELATPVEASKYILKVLVDRESALETRLEVAGIHGWKTDGLAAEVIALIENFRSFESEVHKAFQSGTLEEKFLDLYRTPLPEEVKRLATKDAKAWFSEIAHPLIKQTQDMKSARSAKTAQKPAVSKTFDVSSKTEQSNDAPHGAATRKDNEVSPNGMSFAVSGTIPDVTKPGKRVFVIHGHDPAKDAVRALLLHIGCEPVIFARLRGKASRTNIEILEQEIPACDAVVVLMTPDDEGRKLGDSILEPRARQNVLVEAGFAIISRRNKSVIVATGHVSIPSDFDGIHRIQHATFDKAAEIELAKELEQMLDIEVDYSSI